MVTLANEMKYRDLEEEQTELCMMNRAALAIKVIY